MECRPIEITIQSGKDLKDVNLLSKMDVYAIASIKGDPHNSKQKHKTPVDKDCGTNPRWNHRVSFTVDEPSLHQNRLTVKFELFSDRSLGDREIGEVNVPLKELFDSAGDAKAAEKSSTYAVRTSNGKSKGTLTFSYKFGEKFSAPAKAKKADLNHYQQEPMMAYPPNLGVGASGSSGYPPYQHQPPPQGAYPGHPAQGGYPYPYPAPAQPGYPPQPAYGGYPPPHQPGYGGYPGYPPQPAYGGGYGGAPMMAQKPHKSGGSGGKMALGVGAGLLGGLLVGDMISDVADYDAGYDAGFDDGFDF